VAENVNKTRKLLKRFSEKV